MASQGLFTGMFDTRDLDEEQRRQDEEYAYRMGSMDPDRRLAAEQILAQRQMARGLGQAVGGAFGVDVRSPMEKQQSAIEQVKRAMQASGAQPGTDEYYQALVKAFTDAGMLDQAEAATKAWREKQKEDRLTQSSTWKHQEAEAKLANAGILGPVNKLGEIESALAGMDESDPRYAPLVKQRDLIVSSLVRQSGRSGIVVKDAGNELVVMDQQGNELRRIAKGMTESQQRAADARDRGLDLRAEGAEEKRRKGEEGRNRLEQYAREHAGRLVTFVDLAIKLVNSKNAGPASVATRRVPGTDAYTLNQRLETVRANVGFKELNAMRASSPTGGALGQVTERELAFLQSVEGSLDQGQAPSELSANLKRIRDSAARVVADNGGGSVGSAPSTPAASSPSRSAPRSRPGFSATEVQ